MSNILVFVEQREGKVRKASLESLTLARSLAAKTGGTVAAVVPGSGVSGLAGELAAYGAARVFVADAPSWPSIPARATRPPSTPPRSPFPPRSFWSPAR